MDSVRAMTYNVRVDTPEDAANVWRHRRDAVASTVRYHAPDVVGLQEPLAAQLDDLRERLEGYRFVGQSRASAEAAGEYVPVGYRAARFEAVDSETFWLSETPGIEGSVGWDATHPRVCTRATLRDRESGESVVVFCVHLDHKGREARKRGAELVRERAVGVESGRVLVLGDFNCEAGDPPHDLLASSFDDARAVTPHDHGPNTSRTDFRDLIADWTIDHVFVGDDWTVESRAACSDQYDDGRYPSDHLPVVVDLS
ncbi:endonuclease/exonuclease/phosphatase family protein [Halarchaeum sp. CBA1220]|uniref:endonuclease/exonuclease/phosphatase family protein n=1 Tax=Halarchaeum sp. CBA1220 TaxID=1853682 RepID=UPI0021035BA6|nr:endonuclease/exonuclease/phosphatase family protein [Halarchaeum sp. CBA1220]